MIVVGSEAKGVRPNVVSKCDAQVTLADFELLKVLYPSANEEDFETFRHWVYPPKPYVPPIEYELSKEQKAELKGSSTLTLPWRDYMRSTSCSMLWL